MTMTYNEWKEKYNPIVDDCDNPWVYETYGPDLEIVKLIPENYVWTLIDEGDNNTYLLAGMHLVNRMLYIITNRCWERKGLTAKW